VTTISSSDVWASASWVANATGAAAMADGLAILPALSVPRPTLHERKSDNGSTPADTRARGISHFDSGPSQPQPSHRHPARARQTSGRDRRHRYPVPEQRLDAPIGMSVITAKQIAESAAKTLPQLLSQEAGIVTRDNTGGRIRRSTLRGFGITGDQNTLVLVNGQRSTTSSSHHRLDRDPLDSMSVSRSSRLGSFYGGGATGAPSTSSPRRPPRARRRRV